MLSVVKIGMLHTVLMHVNVNGSKNYMYPYVYWNPT